MNANQIIRRPLVTEKSTILREQGHNVIAFEVDPAANKVYWANEMDGISFANADGSGGGGNLSVTGTTLARAAGTPNGPALLESPSGASQPVISGGSVAIGALAIGRLAIRRGAIGSLNVKRLEVGSLTVGELNLPSGRAGVSP